MRRLSRRELLRTLLIAPAARVLPAFPRSACWLRVTVPFLMSDFRKGIESHIVLFPTSFAGRRGFEEKTSGNRYRIHLYDGDGDPIVSEGLPDVGQRSLGAFRSEVVSLRSLLPSNRTYWGSATIEVIPREDVLVHLGDLFSAAFVRWDLESLFDCIHANPDPPQLSSGAFASTMPFLPTNEWATYYTVFNPAARSARGVIRLFDMLGIERRRLDYRVRPKATRIFRISRSKSHEEPESILDPSFAVPEPLLQGGGTVSIENEADSPKCFSYMLVRGGSGKRQFAVEHPIFQGEAPPSPGLERPLDPAGKLRARTMVFTPLWFSGARKRGLTLDSTACLSSGRGLGSRLWMQPFVTGPDGAIHWTSTRDAEFGKRAGALSEGGYLKLAPFQSITIGSRDLGLDAGFAGGFALATTPETNHSLMKIQVKVREWESFALSHFRPGSRLARPLATIPERGGLASDYVVAGIRITLGEGNTGWDSLLAVYNIEFEDERTGTPIVQLFGPSGLIRQKRLEIIPPLGSLHLWISEIFPGLETPAGEVWSLRLMDETATTVVSAIHFDFSRKQLGIDHGSDRFSTYLDYPCT